MHSHAAGMETSATASTKSQCGARKTRARTSGMRTAAVRIRFICLVEDTPADQGRAKRLMRQMPCEGAGTDSWLILNEMLWSREFPGLKCETWGTRAGSARDDVDAVGVFFHLANAVAHAAVAAFTALKVGDRFEQVDAAKIGPEHVGDVNLGIGALPQQKIRQPHFARGADEQIRIGHVRRV